MFDCYLILKIYAFHIGIVQNGVSDFRETAISGVNESGDEMSFSNPHSILHLVLFPRRNQDTKSLNQFD